MDQASGGRGSDLKKVILGLLSLSVLTACDADAPTPVDTPTPRQTLSPTAAGTVPPRTSPSVPASPAFQGTLITVSYMDGVVTPEPSRVAVALGAQVRIELSSDRPDELHVHAYDHKVEVTPGETAVLGFVADIPGRFEVELERSKVRLFELEVR